MFDVIAFDADDTLWHNENIYAMTQEQYRLLLLPFADAGQIDEALYATEMRNLAYYGYGIKSFTLSMVETAVTLTNGRINGDVIQTILQFSKEMRDHPIQLMNGIEGVLDQLSHQYRLMLITKGDLFEQESKVARSGLAERFAIVEIVSEKDAATYAALFERHDINPTRLCMIGNSVRSDILPIVEIGGTAVHIPYHLTWAHETVGHAQPAHNGYYELEDIRQLPAFLQQLTVS